MATTGSRPARPAPEILTLARQVAAIVRRATGDASYLVFLFGSHVSGEAGPRSDLDIGIHGPRAVEPRVMQEIRAACDRLATLRTIDIVDLARVGPDFRRAATLWPIEPGQP